MKQFGLLSFSFLFAATALAQSTHVHVLAPSGDGCMKGNFERNVSALPENFNCGNKIADILSGVQNLRVEKDKYESSAQHAQRMKKALEGPLYQSVRGADTLAIVTQVKPTYNADKARFEIPLPTELLSNYKYALRVDHWETGTRNYLAQNAYGATANVRQKNEQSIVLYSPGMNVMSSYQWLYHKMAPSEAKKMDGHRLALLYIGKIAAPYFQNDFQKLSASMSSPAEYQTRIAIIGFKLEETWLYDMETGKILSKKMKITK